MTLVVNFYAGPGAGKSTLAAEAFAALKHEQQVSVELVREYVKDWAWRGLKPAPWDELYLLAKQLHRESVLYGKVDCILTDSPLGAKPVFERRYSTPPFLCTRALEDIRLKQKACGVRQLDLFVARTKEYDVRGRFGDYESAIEIDEMILSDLGDMPRVFSCHDALRAIRRALAAHRAIGRAS